MKLAIAFITILVSTISVSQAFSGTSDVETDAPIVESADIVHESSEDDVFNAAGGNGTICYTRHGDETMKEYYETSAMTGSPVGFQFISDCGPKVTTGQTTSYYTVEVTPCSETICH